MEGLVEGLGKGRGKDCAFRNLNGKNAAQHHAAAKPVTTALGIKSLPEPAQSRCECLRQKSRCTASGTALRFESSFSL